MGFLDAQAVREKSSVLERMEVEPKLDVSKPSSGLFVFERCRLDEFAVSIVILRWEAILNFEAKVVTDAFNPIINFFAMVALKHLAISLEAEAFLGAQELRFVRPPRVPVPPHDFNPLLDSGIVLAEEKMMLELLEV
jgi:hypothetical protein